LGECYSEGRDDPAARNKGLIYEKWGDRTEILKIVHGGGK